MKIYYLLISLSSLLLIGCSSTYKVSDFPSRDKFYEDFNNFSGYRIMDVTLKNDSTFKVPVGAKIFNDTLIFMSLTNNQKREEIILKNDINNISFNFNTETKSTWAEIILKNGSKILCESAELLPDSSVRFMKNTNEYLSINKIKEISYKNHLLGIPIPLISGAVIGFLVSLVGGQIYLSLNRNNQIVSSYDYLFGFSGAGLLAGGIWGGIDGWTYTYQFTP
jgi:hypothetical protein